MWAAVSGIGAALLVSEVTQFLAGFAFHAIGPFVRNFGMATLAPVVTIAGTAAGAAVAFGVGGPIALALNVAFLGLGAALRIPSLVMFCERSGGGLGLSPVNPCAPEAFVASLWPQIVGIGLGVLLMRGAVTRGAGINSLLRIAGAYAIALFVVHNLWAIGVARAVSPLASGLTISAAMVAAAAAAGAVAAQLPRGIRNALVVACVSLLPWLAVQLPLSVQSLGPTVEAEFVALILASIVTQPIASAVLVLSAALTSRSRYVPRGLRRIDA